MRIGIVCPYSFDEPGGVQAHVLDLARHFRRAGHFVRVLGPASPETPLPDFVTRGGPAIPIPYNGSVARLSLGPHVHRITREFILEGDFDVLHIHEPNSPSYSMAALYAADGPIVATYHASASGSRALKLSVAVLRPMLEKIRGGIAVSEMARRWQVEMLGGDPILIPNGVDTASFRAARRPPSAVVPEIVFLGRVDEPRKGFGIFRDAIEELRRVGVEARVTVMGKGEHTADPAMDFLGRVSEEEKAEVLGRADIYVAPNTGGESFGIVLVEAMAAGCAVVASDLEAFAGVCNAHSTHPAGVLFPTGDSSALAAALRELINSPERRARLVAAGSARAQRFDWDTVGKEIMRVYRAVADGTKVRTR